MTDLKTKNVLDIPDLRMHREEFLSSGVLEFRRTFRDDECLIEDHKIPSFAYSAVSVTRISDVKVWTDNGTICVYDDTGIYEELSLTFDSFDLEKIKDTPISESMERVVLLPHLSPENYYHWLVDTVPCFGVLEMAGIKRNDFDELYLHRTSSFQRRHLKQLGYDPDTVHATNYPNRHFSVAELIVPFFRLDGGWPNAWAIEYLKRTWIPQIESSATSNTAMLTNSRKIYLLRGNARRGVINEIDLIPRLVKSGFEIVNVLDMTLEEQAQCFHDADCVLAAHGAALANIVFCKPETKVMEFTGQYITFHFRMLSELNNLDYRCISAVRNEMGEVLPVSSDAMFRSDDFTVDVDLVVSEATAFFDI